MTTDTLNDHLDALRDLLLEIQTSRIMQARDAGETFLWHVYEIGLAVTLEPTLASTPALVEFIARSVEPLNRHSMTFGKLYSETLDLLEGSWDYGGEEWEMVCRRWSAGWFLRQLWAGTALADEFQYFTQDDESLDELRAKGDEYGPVPADRRPPGIPPSHWWWWYPEQPPS